jgi:hypothetical protein
MSGPAKTKKCPGCGRFFIKGKLALVQGRSARVCLTCATNAVRVITSVTVAKCTGKRCNGLASMCANCVGDQVREATKDPMGHARVALEAAIGGLTLVEPRDDKARDFIAGKVEGLQSALYLLTWHTPRNP